MQRSVTGLERAAPKARRIEGEEGDSCVIEVEAAMIGVCVFIRRDARSKKSKETRNTRSKHPSRWGEQLEGFNFGLHTVHDTLLVALDRLLNRSQRAWQCWRRIRWWGSLRQNALGSW